MTIIPITEFKVRLSSLLDGIVKKHEEIIITKNGKPAAVLVNADEYESLKETCEVMSDPDMLKQIQETQTALAKGDVKSYTIDELFGS